MLHLKYHGNIRFGISLHSPSDCNCIVGRYYRQKDFIPLIKDKGTRMQDIILIHLGFKTSAHTMQLHNK
jgi:hypothetical protein